MTSDGAERDGGGWVREPAPADFLAEINPAHRKASPDLLPAAARPPQYCRRMDYSRG